VHGIDPQLRERLGGMPQAHGIPGLLLREGVDALRLSEVSAHPASVGLPHGHPPMRTFLGVPVRVQGRIFGNLYVAEKEPGTGVQFFTGDDEEALLALGAAAGVAIENARLYAAADFRRRWSEAAGVAVHAVLTAAGSGDLLDRLAAVPQIARQAGGCDVAVLAVPGTDDRWLWRYQDGDPVPNAEASPGVEPVTAAVPGPSGPAGEVPAALAAVLADLVEPRPLTGAELALVGGPAWRAGDLVPVLDAEHHPWAVLLLARRRPLPGALGATDISAPGVFGQRVGLALEVARGSLDAAQVTLLRDRDRIARDLHDHVIQRLFAVGLSLQAALVAARVPEVADRVGRAVDDIDETIKEVRRTIFGLHGSGVGSELRTRVDEVVAEAAEGLGTPPRLFVEGPLSAVGPDLSADVVAVLREGLSNVVRHAGARQVEVFVCVARTVEIEVVDDGCGVAADSRRSGLVNLAHRAAVRGGTCELEPRPEGGTVLRWSVPLSPAVAQPPA
jgi:signal transduction histidine kinase